MNEKQTILNEIKDGVDAIGKDLREVEETISRLEETVDGHSAQIEKLDSRVGALEGGAGKAVGAPIRKISPIIFSGERSPSRGKFVDFLKAVRDMDERKAKALGGQVDPSGGYLVPTEHLPLLARVVEDYGVARKLATVLPMASDTMNVPILTSAVNASWVSEGAVAPDTEPSFGQAQIVAKEARFKTVVSNALLEDSDPRIAEILITLFGEAIAKAEDFQVFEGSTVTGHPFDGLRFVDGVMNIPIDPADFSTLDDLIDLEMKVTAGARKGAGYFMASPALARLKKLKDANGTPIWMPPAGELPQTINGYPVYVTEEIPVTLGPGQNQTVVFFGNLRNVYIGERTRFAVKASEHVYFEKDQTVFVGKERVGIKVVLPSAFAKLTGVRVV